MSDPFAKLSWMFESARDLTMEAAMLASSRLSDTPKAKRPFEIQRLLGSRSDREVLKGMKCVMALIATGNDAQEYFAHVVKNVTLELGRVRALVLIYLLKYAETEPDTALLSINSIQKLLSEKLARARASLIRALAGIRIPEIASLILLCIKRTVSDQVPQVRAASALAIGRAYTIDGINQSQLALFLASLVSDPSPSVVSVAIKVHAKLLPTIERRSPKKAWAPVHENFRRLTRILPDLDEWAQVCVIDMLTQYSRKFLPRPLLTFEDGTSMPLPELSAFSAITAPYKVQFDLDLQLFIDSLRRFACSNSAAVILSVTRAIVSVATPEYLTEFGLHKVLTKLATAPRSGSCTKTYGLHIVSYIAQAAPTVFEKYYKKFYVLPTDDNEVASLKLHTLPLLATSITAKNIIRELQYCALNSAFRPIVAHEAVRALGRCSRAQAWTDHILSWCCLQIRNANASLVKSDLLTVIRHLLQLKQSQAGSDKDKLESVIRTIYQLGKLLNDDAFTFDPEAKATIIWLVGEFTEAADNSIGPDLLRRALKNFSNEPETVRYQLLTLAAKSYLYELQRNDTSDLLETTLGKIYTHVSHLARYDTLFETRDHVRMLDQLLLTPKNAKLAVLLLQVPKPAPLVAVNLEESTPDLLKDYLAIEAWADPKSLPPKSIRKEKAVETVPTSFENGAFLEKKADITVSKTQLSSSLIATFKPAQAKPYKLQSLDEFFGSEEDSEEEDEEDDSDNTSEQTSEGEQDSDEEESDLETETEADDDDEDEEEDEEEEDASNHQLRKSNSDQETPDKWES